MNGPQGCAEMWVKIGSRSGTDTLAFFFVGLSICRFSRDRPRFNDTLDVIKFLCKDLWTLVFRKQVDNLKTNHRVRATTKSHYFQALRSITERLVSLGCIRLDRQFFPTFCKNEHRNRELSCGASRTGMSSLVLGRWGRLLTHSSSSSGSLVE